MPEIEIQTRLSSHNGHHESLGPAADVVDVEQPVTPSAGGSSFEHTAWLLRAPEMPRQVAFGELPALLTDDKNLVWIELCAYTESDMREVAKFLSLPGPAVEITLGEWRRPRLDVFDNVFFTTATVASLEPEQQRVEARQLALFVGRNLLITIHKQPLPFAEVVLARASSNRDLAHFDSTLMLYIVLDELLAYYELLLEQVQDDIERMEERALSDKHEDFLADLLAFKRYVFALGRLTEQHRNTFAAYLRAEFPFMSDDRIRAQYQALADRLERLIDNLEGTKASVNGAFDIYISHVSHRTNHVMKVLTIISAVLLPVSVIFGFFSTSIEGISFYQPWAMWVMIGLSVACSASALWFFRRSGWL